MKTLLIALSAAAICAATLPANAQVPNPGSEGRIQLKWLTNYDEVLTRAKAEKKPVLIDFTTDWCGWSKKMDRETFAKKDVQKELRDFVLIRINPEAGDENEKIGKKFSVSSYPTLVVANYKGEETGRREGYMEEKATLTFLKEQLPLYKSNPLGYKQVKLDPSDPFYSAMKLLPKPEAMPPENGYIIMLDYTAVDIQADGTAKYEIRTTYYIIDDEQEDLPSPSISYNPSRQKVSFKSVRVLDANGEGREIDRRLVKNKNLYSDESVYWDAKNLSLAVPALKKGQILDVIEEKEVTPVVPGEFYFRWNTGSYVLLDSDVTLRFPSRMDMHKKATRCPTEVKETREKDTIVWRLKTTHPEDDEHELFSAREDSFEGCEFYAGCNPDNLARWYTDLCSGRDVLPPEAKARVADIVKAHPGQLDRAQALFDWVTKDIRYVGVMFNLATHQPHRAQETLKNGYGDCKDQVLLLQALCADAGISSKPVLVGASIDEEVFRTRPAVQMFWHCILEATIEGKPMYLDATAGPGRVGHVPKGYSGQYVLRIDGLKGTPVKLPAYEPESREFSVREIKLNTNGSGTITEKRTYTGERAKEAKKDVKPDEVERMRKKYEASYKRSGSKLTEFSITDSSDPGSNFVWKIGFTSPRIASRTAAGLVVHLGDRPAAWLDRLDTPRTKPFQFQSTDWVNNEVTAILPGKVKELPGDLDLHLPFLEATRKVTLNGNTLRITEKSRMINSRVDAKDARKVVDAFRKISDHQYYGYVIELPVAEAEKKE